MYQRMQNDVASIFAIYSLGQKPSEVGQKCKDKWPKMSKFPNNPVSGTNTHLTTFRSYLNKKIVIQKRRFISQNDRRENALNRIRTIIF